MYLRITRFRVDPAKYDQVMGLTQDIISAIKGQPGVQGAYMAGDRSSGCGAAVTLWDTKEHAQLDRAVLGDVVPRIQALGAQLEPADIYEVSGHS